MPDNKKKRRQPSKRKRKLGVVRKRIEGQEGREKRGGEIGAEKEKEERALAACQPGRIYKYEWQRMGRQRSQQQNRKERVNGRREGKKRSTWMLDDPTGGKERKDRIEPQQDEIRLCPPQRSHDKPQPFQIWGPSLVRLSAVLPVSTGWTLSHCQRHKAKKRASQDGC